LPAACWIICACSHRSRHGRTNKTADDQHSQAMHGGGFSGCISAISGVAKIAGVTSKYGPDGPAAAPRRPYRYPAALRAGLANVRMISVCRSLLTSPRSCKTSSARVHGQDSATKLCTLWRSTSLATKECQRLPEAVRVEVWQPHRGKCFLENGSDWTGAAPVLAV
jgi:hypothetical protein